MLTQLCMPDLDTTVNLAVNLNATTQVQQRLATADNMTSRENSIVSQFSNRSHHTSEGGSARGAKRSAAARDRNAIAEFPAASPIVRARDKSAGKFKAPVISKPEKSIILDADGTLVINPGRPSKDSGTSTASGVTSSTGGGSVKRKDRNGKRRSSISEDHAKDGKLVRTVQSSRQLHCQKSRWSIRVLRCCSLPLPLPLSSLSLPPRSAPFFPGPSR